MDGCVSPGWVQSIVDRLGADGEGARHGKIRQTILGVCQSDERHQSFGYIRTGGAFLVGPIFL